MIQPLRSAHRGIWYALALLIPAVLVAGLLARPHVRSSAPPAATKLRPTFTSKHAWSKLAIETRYYVDGTLPAPSLMFQMKRETAMADPLLFWSPSLPQGDTLPADAVLLGEFAEDTFYPLPNTANPGSHLILYSLAQKQVLDTATLEQLP